LARLIWGLFPLTWSGLLVVAGAIASFVVLGVDRLDLLVLAAAGLGVLLLIFLMARNFLSHLDR